MLKLPRFFADIDWILVSALVPLLFFGLMTMNSFTGESYFASRQLMWVLISFGVFFISSRVDWRILRSTSVLLTIYGFSILLLLFVFFTAEVKGVQSWFQFGGISFQPADFMKLGLILVLAKYFSRRHVEIAHFKHILISGLYTLLPLGLVLIQPDFGSAMIIGAIWFGMILISGVSKKHLFALVSVGMISFALLWMFVFAPYQKARVLTFINPMADPRGAGYNALQSTIAAGSGEILGKGVGYGTQSRLSFLPEYQTDFIFAAFAEEWGFIGSFILIALFGVVVWRIIAMATIGASNFEIFFGVGVALMLSAHFFVHVGMNIGIMPITGIPLPFVSYGGSHLVVEFLALGIISGMRNYSFGFHKEDTTREFVGVESLLER